MAKKNDRKEYNKLKKKKADNKKQQEQCQSEIDVLDEKSVHVDRQQCTGML